MAEPKVHIAATPFRPSSLHKPGTPQVPWSRWKFDDWMLAEGFPSTVPFAPRKATLLRDNLGAEEARIYHPLATSQDEPYSRAVERMEGKFGRPAGIIFERAKFS